MATVLWQCPIQGMTLLLLVDKGGSQNPVMCWIIPSKLSVLLEQGWGQSQQDCSRIWAGYQFWYFQIHRNSGWFWSRSLVMGSGPELFSLQYSGCLLLTWPWFLDSGCFLKLSLTPVMVEFQHSEPWNEANPWLLWIPGLAGPARKWCPVKHFSRGPRSFLVLVSHTHCSMLWSISPWRPLTSPALTDGSSCLTSCARRWGQSADCALLFDVGFCLFTFSVDSNFPFGSFCYGRQIKHRKKQQRS